MSKSIRRNQNVFYGRVDEVAGCLAQRAMNSQDRLWYCCLCVTGYSVFKTGECSLSLIEQHGFLLHLGNSRVKAILLLRLLTAWGNYQPSQWCHHEQRDSHDPFSSIKSLSFVHNANNVPWSEDYQHDNPNSIVYYHFSVLETQIVTTRETQFYRKQIIAPLFRSSIHDS